MPSNVILGNKKRQAQKIVVAICCAKRALLYLISKSELKPKPSLVYHQLKCELFAS